jgi:hypothetical protein
LLLISRKRRLVGPVCLAVAAVTTGWGVGVGTARVGAAPAAPAAGARAAAAAAPVLHRSGWTEFRDESVNLEALDLGLRAAACAQRAGLVENPQTLTLIDYSRRSAERRLWVLDLHSGQVLHRELVAHGQGTGGDLATVFSNDPDSHQSSLGLFVTADTYVGRNGYSLRLDGLDAGFNDRARERAIVMHGAPYVSDAFVRAQGRLGRSWGCPALGDAVARSVIDRIKGGNLVFAYYPDQAWLNGSRLLGDCEP